MKIKIYNTWHEKENIMEATSLKEAKEYYESILAITAENLAENEIEEDWKIYYKTWKEAFNAAYKLIFKQLCSEVEYTIL